jgi:hypothetical protein
MPHEMPHEMPAQWRVFLLHLRKSPRRKIRGMTEKRRTSKVKRLHCNHCRNVTEHRFLKTVEDNGETEEGYWWSTTYDMLQCCGCREVVLRRTFFFSEDPEQTPAVHYFPPFVSRHPPSWQYDIPQKIRAVLDEVYRSLDADTHSLPMMGARALVDMLMVEKVGDVGSFKQKLDTLAADGFIGTTQVNVLDAALDAGGAAAHRGHIPSESEVNAVMDIVENLLHAVYVLPDMAKSLKKTTPPRPKVKGKKK